MKTTDKYFLVGQSVVPCDDLIEWATMFEQQDRRVAAWRRGPILVSTVFLGLDMNIRRVICNPDLPPHLFETMIFLFGTTVDYQTRCATWMEAEAMHSRAIRYVCSVWRRPREDGLKHWMIRWDYRFSARYRRFGVSED